jgi:uncharacterized protein YdaT
MLYSNERYPEEMASLSDEVRQKAIRYTNEMIVDGNVRHHKDLIIVIAIQKAKQWARGQKKKDIH